MTDYKAEAEMARAAPVPAVLRSARRAARSTSPSSSPSTARTRRASSAENEQLCIDGLSHGQRYEVQVRAGLPSDVDEDLTKTIEIAVYVPDRKPFVRFSGKSYVLPSRGQQGIPARLHQHRPRSRSRSTASATATSSARWRAATSSASLQSYELEQIEVAHRREDLHRRDGRAAEAQRGGDDRASRHRGRRHAEARRLRDDRQAVAEVARGRTIPGDAVVHRLRPRPHRLLRRRRRARLRALAGRRPTRRPTSTSSSIARNNEVLGHRQDRRARLRPSSTPASRAAKAACSRRSSSPKAPAANTPSSTSPRAPSI